MIPSNSPHLNNPMLNFLTSLRRFGQVFACIICMLLPALLIIILLGGCGLKKEEPLYSKDEAEKKLIQVGKDEYGWDVNTNFTGNTLWIYIPYEHDIFKFKASRFAQMNKFSVAFLKGNFEEQTFYLDYQIAPLLESEPDKGYTYSLTNEVSEDFHHLLNLIYRVYFNAKQQPEFYVVVMADITNGVEVIYTIYGLDLKKAYNNAVPGQEYYKRILQEIRGSFLFINDKTGRHLTYEEVIFRQFLAKQIAHRIRIKFLSANFKLQGTVEEEILRIISYCLRTYEFQDFSSVTLNNLSTREQITESRGALEEIKEF